MRCRRLFLPLISVLSVLSGPLSAEELAGVPVTVLSRSMVEVPGGTVTYLRIRPPVFPARPAPPPAAPEVPLTPEQQAALLRAEAKPFAMLTVKGERWTFTVQDDLVQHHFEFDGDKLIETWAAD